MLNFVKTYFLKKLVLLSKVRRFLCARWIFLKKLENKFVTHKSNISYHSLFRVLSTGHGKKCKSIDFSPLISGCAGKLSTIMIIFCPFLLNLRSRSRGHSSISFHPSMLFSGLGTDRADIAHGWIILVWQTYPSQTLVFSL